MAVPFWDQVGGGEGPVYSAEPWDALRLNGFRVPGIAIVKCVPRMRIDIAKETGRDGGPAIERGHEPARVDIQVKIWTSEQWLGMTEVVERIWRRPGQAGGATVGGVEVKRAVTIEHPACALFGVASILIETVESPDIPTDGIGVVRIKGMQYIPPSRKSAVRKAAGSGPPLDPRISGARNAKPLLPPSVTDAVARPAAGPRQGS